MKRPWKVVLDIPSVSSELKYHTSCSTERLARKAIDRLVASIEKEDRISIIGFWASRVQRIGILNSDAGFQQWVWVRDKQPRGESDGESREDRVRPVRGGDRARGADDPRPDGEDPGEDATGPRPEAEADGDGAGSLHALRESGRGGDRPDAERYRIYGLDPTRARLRLIATTDTGGLGLALVTLAAEGEFDGYAIGVLDRPEGDDTGTWIINPYGTNAPRRELA